jgi:hypothetical protein
MKRILALFLSITLATCAFAQSNDTPPDKRARKHAKKAEPASTVSNQLREMKESIAAQQQEIDQLRQQLAQRDQALQQTQQQLTGAQSTAQQAQSSAQQAQSTAAQASAAAQGLQTTVADLKTSNDTVVQKLDGTEKRVGDLEAPLVIHFKGISITPGGFLAADSVWRQHATGSDVNTPFNSISYPGAGNYAQSEFFGSGRASRVSLLIEGKTGFAKLGGYYETDWLSSGVTSNNNQSNSYTNRMRQLFAQAALNDGWTFTGGQMWSLVTETTKGTDNRTEALPMTIDAQYTAGFSWARQYAFRVSKNIGNTLWLAASVENPQTTFAAHGQAANFDFGSAGTSAGLYNAFNGTYSFNKSPDFIAKAAIEPGFGHYEVFALVSPFRDRVYPNATASTPNAIGAYNDTRVGGGIGANARVSLVDKHLVVGLHALGGNGVGRYGTSSLPDTTVRPNGTLALLRSYQGLGTVEWHTPKVDLYANAGGEYVSRFYELNSSGKPVGYGAPGFVDYGCDTETVPTANTGFAPGAAANCTADTRNIIEGTFGFWFKPYSGNRGRIQIGPQYSYVVRNAWSGAGATPGTTVQPHTIENMLLTSFRYYIP